MEEVAIEEKNLLDPLAEEEQTEETEEITDPFLKPNAGMDFETFIKKLNAANKSAESAESATGNAN